MRVVSIPLTPCHTTTVNEVPTSFLTLGDGGTKGCMTLQEVLPRHRLDKWRVRVPGSITRELFINTLLTTTKRSGRSEGSDRPGPYLSGQVDQSPVQT